MGFYGDMTAWENLAYVAELNRLERPEGLLADNLKLVGLYEVRDRLVSAFSRGMRQRLGLAEVLIKKPKLIFLDEPTLGLDPDGIATMLGLIERLPKEMGLSVVLSSHLLHLVGRVAHRVAILKKGRLLAMGAVEELAGEAGLAPDLEEVYRHYFRADGLEDAA
jgi:ABC-2 type transport system ATP-binding protein